MLMIATKFYPAASICGIEVTLVLKGCVNGAHVLEGYIKLAKFEGWL